MEWFRRWTVCLLCLLSLTMYRCHSLPSLTSVDGDAVKQREKRSTSVIDETPWSSDYDTEVQDQNLKKIYQKNLLNEKNVQLASSAPFTTHIRRFPMRSLLPTSCHCWWK